MKPQVIPDGSLLSHRSRLPTYLSHSSATTLLTSLRFIGVVCTTVFVFWMKVGLGAGASMGAPHTQQVLALGLFLCPFGHSL